MKTEPALNQSVFFLSSLDTHTTRTLYIYIYIYIQ